MERRKTAAEGRVRFLMGFNERAQLERRKGGGPRVHSGGVRITDRRGLRRLMGLGDVEGGTRKSRDPFQKRDSDGGGKTLEHFGCKGDRRTPGPSSLIEGAYWTVKRESENQ